MRKSKRHIWFVFIILLVPLLAVELISSNKHKYRWVFVYYMSYDNNLGKYGKTILRDLSEGISNDQVAVVTQMDFPDSKGMKREIQYYSHGKKRIKEQHLRSEDSAGIHELEKFLKWVRKKWQAENYCVVFLNHGGMMNSMCLDAKPYRKTKYNNKFPSGKWFRADQVGKVLADFNRSVDGRVRLLFLQQCARGTIQNLYNFTDTSEYLLASPVRVGAPNTYYTKTLEKVSNDPNITGKSLAETIMSIDEQYNIYTLIKTDKLKELPEKISPVLNAFAQAEKLSSPEALKFLFENKDEKCYDLQTYLNALSLANNNIAQNEIQNFFGWCDTQLVESVSFKNYHPSDKLFIPIEPTWRCGLSIYIPTTKEQLNRYDYLPIYKKTNLSDFHKLMLNKG